MNTPIHLLRIGSRVINLDHVVLIDLDERDGQPQAVIIFTDDRDSLTLNPDESKRLGQYIARWVDAL